MLFLIFAVHLQHNFLTPTLKDFYIYENTVINNGAVVDILFVADPYSMMMNILKSVNFKRNNL